MRVKRDQGPVPPQEYDQGAAMGGDTGSAMLREMGAFEMAEASWLAALARFQGWFADPTANDRAAEVSLRSAEREAAMGFALTPLPTLLDLPRKLSLIEREAHEVAHNNFCGKDLTVWLTALRLDLTRLLARPTAAPHS